MQTPRLLAALVVVAVTLTFVTLRRKSFWLDEAFSAWSSGRPASEIWIGAATLAGRARAVVTTLIAVSVIATTWMVIGVPKDDWRGVVGHLNHTVRVGTDVVWLDPKWDSVTYDYYSPVAPAVSGARLSLEQAATGEGILWLVVQRRPGAATPASPSEAWLDANLTLTREVPFARIAVKGYQRVTAR
jgi:hypothetical protein